ncbi:hypothetical protein CHH28_11850 [Bacterioplanes sanyensis]|uniref:STAS domain-containing protein n=1 Tax=Bacterioplanes sanyensis TaxID=1249553 RepID=A0A222FJV9_9GAMM|nr:STAS domain-containing protein [Bacterioplanes sanyensis]ASP39327.1 hypothetical protein CHH28_11850 [Bacterioplanes sanyensis]
MDAQVKQIQLGNELTIYTAAEQRELYLPLPADCRSLVVDASQLQEIDGAGVQLLLCIAKECHEHDIHCQLKQPPQALQEVVELLRLEDIDWFDSVVGEAA